MPPAADEPNLFAAHPLAPALRLELLETGGFTREIDGWVHTKKVPHLILARAVQGRYEVEFDGQSTAIDPACYFVTPPNRTLHITHYPAEDGIMQARWLHLRLRIDGLWDPLDGYHLPRQLSPLASQILDGLLHLTDPSPAGDPLLQSLRRQELALRALCLVCSDSNPKERRPDVTHIAIRLEPALRLVESNPAAKHSVASLAKSVNLSPAHFHDLFLQATGTTPMKWVRTRRLELAAQLLTSGEATLTEIAGRTGFLDAAHLSHAFCRHFGLAPGQYRVVARGYGEPGDGR